jgi:hypothetical protein
MQHEEPATFPWCVEGSDAAPDGPTVSYPTMGGHASEWVGWDAHDRRRRSGRLAATSENTENTESLAIRVLVVPGNPGTQRRCRICHPAQGAVCA